MVIIGALDNMAPSTPSPPVTTASTNGSATSSSMSRRPPRKSTLTQQQKNQKRQRATQDQLITLEVEFNKNPTPTAAVRERIAQDISMTERSVQIWFQNRSGSMACRRENTANTGTQACKNQAVGEKEHRNRRRLRFHPRVNARLPGNAGVSERQAQC